MGIIKRPRTYPKEFIMFDFALPPATAVLPIDAHDLSAPDAPTPHPAASILSASPMVISYANIQDVPYPPPPPQ
jgi:hypothetical protein